MVKTSKHSLQFANNGKQASLAVFLGEYRSAVCFYVDYLWQHLDHTTCNTDKFISTKELFPPDTQLSQRALKCAGTQACGMISAATEKRRRQIYMLSKLQRENKPVGRLIEKMQSQLVKPSVPINIRAELNSICANITGSNGHFDAYLTLASLGKVFGKIQLPIKYHRHSNKLKNTNWSQMTSFLVSVQSIDIRWERQSPQKRTTGAILGADQGITTTLSLSDSQITSKCIHGHDLSSIMKKMSHQKQGSNAFRRSQRHRTNYINWSVKQLNLDGVKELRLEKLYQMRSGVKTDRFRSHFTYTEIRDALKDICEQNGVHFVEQDNKYRSQRCHECGFTHKRNRRGKEMICGNCGCIEDADINAAKNHSIDLFDIPNSFMSLKLNHKSGFFWNTDGLFDINGQELTVPVV